MTSLQKNISSFVLILGILIGAPAVYAQTTTEFDALKHIYNSLGGEEWTDGSIKDGGDVIEKWDINNDTDASNWYGVKIENNHVVELNLALFRLHGTIPAAIKDLTYLKVLNLSNPSSPTYSGI